MARWNDLDQMPEVLEAIDHWREQCFFGDGSVFYNEDLWTLENIINLDVRLNTLLRYKGDFWTKLQRQLSEASPEIIRLMAEVMWVARLLPIGYQDGASLHTKILVSTKREQVKKVLSYGGQEYPNSKFLTDTVLSGFAKPGPSYLQNLPYMLAYFTTVSRAWKELSSQERATYSNPDSSWNFGSFADSHLPSDDDAKPMRHALLFFLYPERFERIVSSTHKKEIVRDFFDDLTSQQQDTFFNSGGWENLTAVDRAIFEIREKLSIIHNKTDLDFYTGELDGIWGMKDLPFPKSSHGVDSHATTSAQLGDNSSDNQIDIDTLRLEELEQKGHTNQTKGEKKLVTHYVRERSPNLRIGKLQKVIDEHGHLKCECCGTIGDTYLPEIRKSVFEVHHKRPLSKGLTINGLDDLALLCANCHRAIHATDPLLSVENFKQRIKI